MSKDRWRRGFGWEDVKEKVRPVIDETLNLAAMAGGYLYNLQYETLWMGRHTSWEPVLFDEGRPKEWVDKGIISYSLPLTISDQGKSWHIPALKDRHVLQHYDSGYPHLVMHFFDPIKEYTGEERVVIEPRGRTADYMEGSVDWEMWLPGNEIKIGRSNAVVTKTQDEWTPIDVGRFLSQEINQDSYKRVSVYEKHIVQALGDITSRSDSMKTRWEMLKTNLDFQKLCLLEHAEATGLHLAMLLKDRPPAEVQGFLQDLIGRKIRTASHFYKRLASLPALTLSENGSAVAVALFGGSQLLPGTESTESLSELRPLLLASFFGKRYFIESVRDWAERIQPKIKELAHSRTDVQVAAMDTLIEGQKFKAGLWRAATAELQKSSDNLQLEIAKKVRKQAEKETRYVGDIIQGKVGLDQSTDAHFLPEVKRETRELPPPASRESGNPFSDDDYPE